MMSTVELECPMCREEYKTPKCLPCAHFICRDCLLTLCKDQQGSCPLCNLPFLSPSGLENGALDLCVNALPTDRATVVSAANCKTLNSRHVCEPCGDDTPATSFCSDCHQKLCQACVIVHARFPALKEHVIQSLSGLTVGRLAVDSHVTCPSHPPRSAELLCPSHNELICTVCVPDHSKCGEIKILRDFAREERDSLENQAQRLLENGTAMNTQIKQLKEEMSEGKKNFEALRLDVVRRFEILQKKLKDRCNELNDCLHEQENEFLQIKKSQLEVLEELSPLVTSHGHAAARAAVLSPDWDFFGTLKTFATLLNELESKSGIDEKGSAEDTPDNGAERADSVAEAVKTKPNISPENLILGGLPLDRMELEISRINFVPRIRCSSESEPSAGFSVSDKLKDSSSVAGESGTNDGSVGEQAHSTADVSGVSPPGSSSASQPASPVSSTSGLATASASESAASPVGPVSASALSPASSASKSTTVPSQPHLPSSDVPPALLRVISDTPVTPDTATSSKPDDVAAASVLTSSPQNCANDYLTVVLHHAMATSAAQTDKEDESVASLGSRQDKSQCQPHLPESTNDSRVQNLDNASDAENAVPVFSRLRSSPVCEESWMLRSNETPRRDKKPGLVSLLNVNSESAGTIELTNLTSSSSASRDNFLNDRLELTALAGRRTKSTLDVPSGSPLYVLEERPIDKTPEDTGAEYQDETSLPEMSKNVYVGSKVQRGKDWSIFYENLDGGPGKRGKVTKVGTGDHSFGKGWVLVQWYSTKRQRWHRLGAEGCYDVKLVL